MAKCHISAPWEYGGIKNYGTHASMIKYFAGIGVISITAVCTPDGAVTVTSFPDCKKIGYTPLSYDKAYDPSTQKFDGEVVCDALKYAVSVEAERFVGIYKEWAGKLQREIDLYTYVREDTDIPKWWGTGFNGEESTSYGGWFVRAYPHPDGICTWEALREKEFADIVISSKHGHASLEEAKKDALEFIDRLCVLLCDRDDTSNILLQLDMADMSEENKSLSYTIDVMEQEIAYLREGLDRYEERYGPYDER